MRLFFRRLGQPGRQHRIISESCPDHGRYICERGTVGPFDGKLSWFTFGKTAHTDAEKPNTLTGELHLLEQLGRHGPDLRRI